MKYLWHRCILNIFCFPIQILIEAIWHKSKNLSKEKLGQPEVILGMEVTPG